VQQQKIQPEQAVGRMEEAAIDLEIREQENIAEDANQLEIPELVPKKKTSQTMKEIKRRETGRASHQKECQDSGRRS
jgi:hypothetical protein